MVASSQPGTVAHTPASVRVAPLKRHDDAVFCSSASSEPRCSPTLTPVSTLSAHLERSHVCWSSLHSAAKRCDASVAALSTSLVVALLSAATSACAVPDALSASSHARGFSTGHRRQNLAYCGSSTSSACARRISSKLCGEKMRSDGSGSSNSSMIPGNELVCCSVGADLTTTVSCALAYMSRRIVSCAVDGE